MLNAARARASCGRASHCAARLYRVMTFNCDVSSNHGRLTDSDTLWRAVILHGEAWSPAEKDKGRGRKMKKKTRRRRERVSRRRVAVVPINWVYSRENNYELMNVIVAMATSIAYNCFIFISCRGTRASCFDRRRIINERDKTTGDLFFAVR